VSNAIKKQIMASSQSDFELTGEAAGEQVFRFSEAFLGFEGHFPGRPVLPAIVQLLIAQCVAEAVEKKSMQLLAVPKAKFLSVLGPDQEIVVRCRKIASKQNQRFDISLHSGDVMAASIVMEGGFGNDRE